MKQKRLVVMLNSEDAATSFRLRHNGQLWKYHYICIKDLSRTYAVVF